MMMRPSALSRFVPSASGGDAAVRRQRMLRRVWDQALVFSPRQSLLEERSIRRFVVWEERGRDSRRLLAALISGED
jgi:hypothetical protein